MTDNKVFTEKGIGLQDSSKPASGELDGLDKVNKFVTNIDSLLKHFNEMKRNHPEIMGRLGALTGNNPQLTQGAGQGSITQFSPQSQPQGSSTLNVSSKNVSSEKLYTMLLGLLHQFEGKKLTVEDFKKVMISNKGMVMAQLKESIPNLLED